MAQTYTSAIRLIETERDNGARHNEGKLHTGSAAACIGCSLPCVLPDDSACSTSRLKYQIFIDITSLPLYAAVDGLLGGLTRSYSY